MLFKLNSFEKEMDTLDFETMDMVEKNLEEVGKKQKSLTDRALKGGMRQTTLIKEGCEIITSFFDAVFGPGSSLEIFEGRVNYGEALKVFGEFVLQKNNSGDDVRRINDEYIPKIKGTLPNGGNRAQRRSQSKKKKSKNPNISTVK